MNAAAIMSLGLLVAGFHSAARAAVPAVTINEVLANPLDEDTGEFVELLNWGEVPVDVAGWRLADSADTNDLIEDYTGPGDWGAEGTVIPPGGYALIVDPEYAGEYALFLAANADPDQVVLLTIGKDTTLGNGLTNAQDAVFLSSGGLLLAVFGWNSDPGQGISWEKIEAQQGDGEGNWGPCQHLHGSTPGARNSLSRALYDVRVPAGDVAVTPSGPWPGEEVEIRAGIHNQGKMPAGGVEVHFFHDTDADTLLDEGERIGPVHLITEEMLPDEMISLRQSWTPPASGSYLLVVWASFPQDEDPADNFAVIPLQVRHLSWSMVINEIMYDPAPTDEESEKEPEWVEVFVPGGDAIDLAGWTIEDSRSDARTVCDSIVLLQPGGYAVLAAGGPEDFRQAHPQVTCPVLFPRSGLPSLNNSEDLLLLRDPLGTTVDSVLYAGKWGGGGGISLERINPFLGSNDPLNWSWCVDPSGATPGERNSLFTAVVPVRTALSASPNPFSPDGDGRQEVTIISYRLPATAALLRLYLFDIHGRRVRILADGLRCASRGEVIWDGKTDDGLSLKMGIYIIYLEALDDRRGVVCRSKTTVVLAGRLD